MISAALTRRAGSASVDGPVQEAVGERLAYWVLDRTTGVGARSSALGALIGEEHASRNLSGLLRAIHPEDRDRIAGAIADHLRGGDPVGGAFRLAGGRLPPALVEIGGRVVEPSAEPGSPRFLVLTFAPPGGRPEAESAAARFEATEGRVRELAEADGRGSDGLDTEDPSSVYLTLVENVPYAIFRKAAAGRYTFGNRVLQRLGPRLERVLGPGETIARLGGNEFGVPLPGDRSQSGHAFYASDQASKSPERMALLGDLRRALGLGQFLLHYQPKVDVATGAARGAEALIHWQHPTEGLIALGRFIPLAEQVGLIRAIDLWAVVALGHNLGLKVTAEGVEDATTLEILQTLGCDLAQGYHIGRPMPLIAFETWLAARPGFS